ARVTDTVPAGVLLPTIGARGIGAADRLAVSGAVAAAGGCDTSAEADDAVEVARTGSVPARTDSPRAPTRAAASGRTARRPVMEVSPTGSPEKLVRSDAVAGRADPVAGPAGAIGAAGPVSGVEAVPVVAAAGTGGATTARRTGTPGPLG